MPTLPEISKQLLEAMKSKDPVRVSTLRMLISAIRYKEVEKKKDLSEGEVLEVIQSEAKRRKESIDEYTKAGRADLAAKEEAELNVLKVYLPQPLSEAELKAMVQSAIQSSGAKGAAGHGPRHVGADAANQRPRRRQTGSAVRAASALGRQITSRNSPQIQK